MPIIAKSTDGSKIEQCLRKIYRKYQNGTEGKNHFPKKFVFNPTNEEVKIALGVTELPDYCGHVPRIVRLPDMAPFSLMVPQYRVKGHATRILPAFLLAYKQYPIFVIEDVLNREMPPKNIINGNDEAVPVIINPNFTTPVWDTRNNWKHWFKLNLSLFSIILGEMYGRNESGKDSWKKLSAEDLMHYFRIKNPTGWLRYLVDASVKRQIKLKSAPWVYAA